MMLISYNCHYSYGGNIICFYPAIAQLAERRTVVVNATVILMSLVRIRFAGLLLMNIVTSIVTLHLVYDLYGIRFPAKVHYLQTLLLFSRNNAVKHIFRGSQLIVVG